MALPSPPFPACCSASSPGYLTTKTLVRNAGRDEVGAGRPHLVTSSHTLGRDKHCHACSPGGQDIPRWDRAALLPSFLCGGDGLAQAGPAAPVPNLLPWLLAHNPREAGEGQPGFRAEEGPQFAGKPLVLQWAWCGLEGSERRGLVSPSPGVWEGFADEETRAQG